MDVRFPPYVGTSASGAMQGPRAAGSGDSSVSGFSGALKAALGNVSALQNESAALQRQFQLGADGVSLEQTMIAMQRSQIGFQAALTVRNRLVAAYTDIMNMPV